MRQEGGTAEETSRRLLYLNESKEVLATPLLFMLRSHHLQRIKPEKAASPKSRTQIRERTLGTTWSGNERAYIPKAVNSILHFCRIKREAWFSVPKRLAWRYSEATGGADEAKFRRPPKMLRTVEWQPAICSNTCCRVWPSIQCRNKQIMAWRPLRDHEEDTRDER